MPRPAHVRELGPWCDPERVFQQLGPHEPWLVWLDSGVSATRGKSIIAVGHPGSTVVTAYAASGILSTRQLDGDATAVECMGRISVECANKGDDEARSPNADASDPGCVNASDPGCVNASDPGCANASDPGCANAGDPECADKGSAERADEASTECAEKVDAERVEGLSDGRGAAASLFDRLAAVLSAELTGLHTVCVDPPGSSPSAVGSAGLLGWYGWFGDELGASINGVVPSASDAPGASDAPDAPGASDAPDAPGASDAPDAPDAPDAVFLFVDRALVFDHETRTVRLVWCGDDHSQWATATERSILAWAAEETLPSGTATPGGGVKFNEPSATTEPEPAEGFPSIKFNEASPLGVPRWHHTQTEYADLIVCCQTAIARGDAYQLCLTNHIDIDGHPDPVATYLALRHASPSHHGGFLRFGEHALLSASPEQFVRVTSEGLVETRPMKGTRPRGDDEASDRALRAELLASDKERAENLMIVDLMRNDLSRIARLGTVTVPSLLVVEQYAQVHQLVSTVQARLRSGLTALDVVRAAFPAGSMTGAPKQRAMELLREFEDGPRGVYSGVFGSLGLDGSADLAMVIRSIVLTPTGASIGTGGGVTALSHVAEEIAETQLKARVLLQVLGASLPTVR